MSRVRGSGERTLDVRSILALSSVYRLFGVLIGAHRARVDCVKRYIRPRVADRVLDCGCGPADLLDDLPPLDYVGIDIDPRYIAAAQRRYGGQATFRLGAVGPETIWEEGHYDLVLAWGLLHHLEDDEVREFLLLARRCLKPMGRLITMDGCYSDSQSRAARFLLNLDRGAHIRSLEAWLELVRPVFPSVKPHLRQDLLRIPWTHLIMECPTGSGENRIP